MPSNQTFSLWARGTNRLVKDAWEPHVWVSHTQNQFCDPAAKEILSQTVNCVLCLNDKHLHLWTIVC